MSDATCSKETASIDSLRNAGLCAARTALESFGEIVRMSIAMNPVLGSLKAHHGTCEIPPACWLPRALGEVRSLACAGATTSIRIRVTNCQPVPSTVQVAVKSGLDAKVTPESASIGPMERQWFNVTVTLPADASVGQEFESLVWVLGCNAHYLRWTVAAADHVCGSCHALEVEDCPDYVHHWYDHFYCNRPCFAKVRETNLSRG